MTERKNDKVKRIKTGRLERRWSLAATGMVSGTRAATKMWGSLMAPKAERQQRQQQLLAQEAQYIADELGKLKGSVVKVGQVMAIYGEHILPDEVVTALRSLEERTTPVDWSVMQPQLEKELGDYLSELEVDPEPIGAASLGQVHRAEVKATGEQICLKIQYPGVAEAIDSDLNDVTLLLKLARVVTLGKDFDEWVEEIRQMLHREVDYCLEADTTEQFAHLLASDHRYVVPTIYRRYSTAKILAASYESGYAVNDPQVATMPLAVRNQLGIAFLELFLHELFDWGILQTDPNFGNYRIRLNPQAPNGAEIVLLDFGAVQAYPNSFLEPVKAMVTGGYYHDRQRVIDGAVALGILKADFPEDVLSGFANFCYALMEPFRVGKDDIPDGVVSDQGKYRWAHCNLPKRVAKQAAKAAFNRYFFAPPKEFTFLSRKLLGVFGFIAALQAEFNAEPLIQRYTHID